MRNVYEFNFYINPRILKMPTCLLKITRLYNIIYRPIRFKFYTRNFDIFDILLRLYNISI